MPWEALLAGGLMLVALLIRLPYLLTIPAFSDELDEVQRGLAILRAEEFPLTNHTTYIGALFNYLVAAAFLLFGPQWVVPRALVLTVGVLTVGAAYLLGRQTGGRLGGLVAAALLATSGTHVLINSHIALSSSTTPLFLTLAVWLIGRAALERHGPSLAAGGLLLGLALQTHPTVVAAILASGLYLLLQARPLLRSRWLPLALGALLLGYGNMLVYNLTTGFESVQSALTASEDYQEGQDDRQPPYSGALVALLLATSRLLAGALQKHLDPRALLLDPLVLIYAALALAGLVLAARRGLGLWGLTVLTWLLLLPVFNWKYNNLVLSRWINPIAPICYAAIGLVVASLWARLPARRARLALTAVVVLLLLQPLGPLGRHYVQVAREGPTNVEPLRLAGLLERSRYPEERVVIDATLQRYGLENGGTVSKALRYALTVSQVPLVRLTVTEQRLADTLGAEPSILLATDERKVEDLADDFHLEPLDPPDPDDPPYRGFRVTRKVVSGQ
jgi:4-amino-4-deoxy-L-arabinose transferase-like glycosyltransferase